MSGWHLFDPMPGPPLKIPTRGYFRAFKIPTVGVGMARKNNRGLGGRVAFATQFPRRGGAGYKIPTVGVSVAGIF